MTNEQKQEVTKCIGALIKEHRMKLGLSQEEVTWRSGLSKNAYCSIELAKSDAKLTNIFAIFSALEIDFQELNRILNKIINS